MQAIWFFFLSQHASVSSAPRLGTTVTETNVGIQLQKSRRFYVNYSCKGVSARLNLLWNFREVSYRNTENSTGVVFFRRFRVDPLQRARERLARQSESTPLFATENLRTTEVFFQPEWNKLLNSWVEFQPDNRGKLPIKIIPLKSTANQDLNHPKSDDRNPSLIS